MFFKRGVIRNFAIFAEKNVCAGVSFKQSCRPYGLQLYFSLVPKDTSTQVFYCEYCKIFTNSIFL